LKEFPVKNRVFAFGILFLLATSYFIFAKDKEKQFSGQMVDSGSFGIFQNGRRVASELFSISTSNGVSTVTSQIQQADTQQTDQTSEMQIASDGSLISYEWRQMQEPNAELTLLPKNEFLTEQLKQSAASKPIEHPFLMPKTSIVLDDNFTVQREVFAWRFLASACQQEKTDFKCAATSFGTIDPQESVSIAVTAQPGGVDQIVVKGVKRQLWRVNLKSDSEGWSLWLDPADHYKLIRLARSGVDMEVVRD
jgi:hypothetical protein